LVFEYHDILLIMIDCCNCEPLDIH